MSISNLTQLIHGLKSGEVLLLRNYYKSMITLKDTTKRLNLFNLIKSKRYIISEEDACKAIYNAKPNSAFGHLKRRLRTDILSILLLQDSKRRFNAKNAQAEFDVRRKIIEGDILISRGITKEGISILQEAAKTAKEYELFNESLQASELLFVEFLFKKGIREYENFKKEISDNINKLTLRIKAKDYYHKILAPHLFNLSNGEKYIEFAEMAKNDLKKDYEETKSVRIGYYYFYISTLYYNLKKDYGNALKAAEEYLKINSEQKSINSKRSVASAHLQLSYIHLQRKKFDLSIKHSHSALKLYKSGLSNELTTLELLFLASFYSNKNTETEAVLAQALSHPKLHSNKFLPAKWHYYKACFLFRQKKYDEANDAMNNCTYLLEDKTGWLYGYRILDIMIVLESNDLFLIDGKVANFKKIIGKQKDINSSRAKTTLKILDALVRKHYDYNLAAKNQRANITTLQEAVGEHLWEPMGYELIRFEEWFATKLSKRKSD